MVCSHVYDDIYYPWISVFWLKLAKLIVNSSYLCFTFWIINCITYIRFCNYFSDIHVVISLCSPCCQWTPIKYFYPPFKSPCLIRPVILSHPFCNVQEQKLLFLDLLTSFIKFKTSDFSKHESFVMTLWYYTWKHSQIYYNKVYCICKLLCTNDIRVNSVKRNSQACIT